MNKRELAIAIDQIGEGFHLVDFEGEDDLDKAFRETMDILCDYDEDGVKMLIDDIRQTVNLAIQEEWNKDPEYDETFALCETVIDELEQLLEDCYSGKDDEQTKCEVVNSIMSNPKMDDSTKIWRTKMYLKGCLTKEQATRC